MLLWGVGLLYAPVMVVWVLEMQKKNIKDYIMVTIGGEKFYLHRTDDLIGKLITRPLGVIFTRLIIKTPIEANHISAISLLLAILSAVLISFSDYTYNIIACSILFVVSMLDCVDGVLARYRRKFTKFGVYMEYLFHELVPPSLFFALGVNSYKYLNNIIPLYLGGIVVLLIFFISTIRSSKERIVFRHILETKKIPNYVQDKLSKEPKKSFLSLLVFVIIRIFNTPGHFYTLLLILSLLDKLHYAIFFYSVFYFVIAIGKGYVEFKQGFKPYGLE